MGYKKDKGLMGIVSKLCIAQSVAICAGYASYPFDTIRRSADAVREAEGGVDLQRYWPLLHEDHQRRGYDCTVQGRWCKRSAHSGQCFGPCPLRSDQDCDGPQVNR